MTKINTTEKAALRASCVTTTKLLLDACTIGNAEKTIGAFIYSMTERNYVLNRELSDAKVTIQMDLEIFRKMQREIDQLKKAQSGGT